MFCTSFLLPWSMYKALNERSYWLIGMNIRKTLSTSIDFTFQSPKLSRESCFALSLNYAGLCKERFSKQVTQLSAQSTFKENCRNTKKINFQFHHRKFSEQRHSILSYYSRRVIRGGRGRFLSCTFLKIGRRCPDFGKRWKGALILAIYVLNFSKCFPVRPCSFCPRRAIWRKIMEALKALTLTIICTKVS